MRYGSKSENVKQLQSLLNALGTMPPLVVDGVFGKATDAAVRQFQSNSGIAVDGVVGLNTLEALKQAVAAKGVKASVPALDPAVPAKIDINPMKDTVTSQIKSGGAATAAQPTPAAASGGAEESGTGGSGILVAAALVGLGLWGYSRMRRGGQPEPA